MSIGNRFTRLYRSSFSFAHYLVGNGNRRAAPAVQDQMMLALREDRLGEARFSLPAGGAEEIGTDPPRRRSPGEATSSSARSSDGLLRA